MSRGVGLGHNNIIDDWILVNIWGTVHIEMIVYQLSFHTYIDNLLRIVILWIFKFQLVCFVYFLN